MSIKRETVQQLHKLQKKLFKEDLLADLSPDALLQFLIQFANKQLFDCCNSEEQQDSEESKIEDALVPDDNDKKNRIIYKSYDHKMGILANAMTPIPQDGSCGQQQDSRPSSSRQSEEAEEGELPDSQEEHEVAGGQEYSPISSDEEFLQDIPEELDRSLDDDSVEKFQKIPVDGEPEEIDSEDPYAQLIIDEGEELQEIFDEREAEAELVDERKNNKRKNLDEGGTDNAQKKCKIDWSTMKIYNPALLLDECLISVDHLKAILSNAAGVGERPTRNHILSQTV